MPKQFGLPPVHLEIGITYANGTFISPSLLPFAPQPNRCGADGFVRADDIWPENARFTCVHRDDDKLISDHNGGAYDRVAVAWIG